MKKPLHPARPVAASQLPLKRLGGQKRRADTGSNNFSTAQLVKDLRHSQAELEIQNKALRFSQAAAEGASERFVTLFSNVPLALMVVDEHGQILELNARALALMRPLEDDPPLNFLFPLVRDMSASQPPTHRVMQGFETASAQGTCELSELEFLGGSNGVFVGDLHIARIDSAPDSPLSYICAIIDQGPLLAQRQALQTSSQALQERNNELLQSKTRLSAIIDSSLDVIICIDARQQVIVFNPAAASLFKCPTDQALGLALTHFLPDAERALSYSDIARHAQVGEMIGVTSAGESVPLDVSLSFEKHPSGDIITLFARDLTVSKKMEAHRAALETQLRESQKMQAIGTMAGGIAHDFNNIISAILGNVELARQDDSASPAVTTSLSEIDKAGRRARDLVRQILTFSRNEPPRRVALQLADVVHETMRLIRVTLPPKVSLTLDLPALPPLVLADATQVEQVLLNLCTNAIHAIGQNTGSIRVALSYRQQPAPALLALGEELSGAHILLKVSDTGCGMNDATLERVFEPFFTTKPVGQGTGLGLSVVHGIMRAHSGAILVHSTPGEGTEFSLFFPVVDLPAPPPCPPAAIASAVRGQGQRVMYVDDDEALVFLVKRLLTRKGYAVVTFSDPRLAAQSLRDDPLQCDLLVTDFNMPGYSGVDLLREVRTIRPDLPVALASGYVTPEIERDALAAGARALIHKPNDVDELCNTVQQLLSVASSAPCPAKT
ncbi:MAG: response regulator [Comamonadaceae bacterium]|nr:response regulator [Comamonadaceae bacterium]